MKIENFFLYFFLHSFPHFTNKIFNFKIKQWKEVKNRSIMRGERGRKEGSLKKGCHDSGRVSWRLTLVISESKEREQREQREENK